MNMTMSWSLHRQREVAAQIGTVMAGLLILVLSKTIVMHEDVSFQEVPISLSIIEPDPIPDPIKEKPVEIVPPKPEKVVTPTKMAQPVQTVQPAKSEKVVAPSREVMPVVDTPVTTQEKAAVPVASALPKEEPVAPKHEEPKAQRASNGASEGGFAQDVRSRIERKKIYPEAARDLGMSGEVEVLYELDRSGALIRAEVVTSSGYKLLDQAALKAVKSVSYSSFPDDAWIGAGSKEFRTKLVFQLNK
jgi:protein TonB